jgi:hypothetical protein
VVRFPSSVLRFPFYVLRAAFCFPRFTHQYIGTPAAMTASPADATPGASTTVLMTIAKLTRQNSAGAQG